MIIDLIGYIASFFIALSFFMKDMNKLRVYGLIASVAFLIYGILLQANPLIVTNLFCSLFNAYHLLKTYRSKNSPVPSV
ncbi:YgjV family protein [Thaumasiovibrio sp. DFM-14]|uniref:YgjV family protein n=1 Tax=Thaumasiovibrio sp. DFM-14 TaxID=3384792 RepID=UPI0039A1D2C9